MISVCILTKNASATLKETLDSVRNFPEVLLLDNGSTDETIKLAQTYPNVRIYHHPFIGFGPLRNQAAALASHDWILALDSDEVLSPSLQEEIQALPLTDSTQIFAIQRHNYYKGKRIQGCGWESDWVARLYHRHFTTYKEVAVHEALLLKETKPIRLKNPLLHTPYRTTADFLQKMQHYSTLFAEEYQSKKKGSLAKAIGHGLFAFIRSYILKRGFLFGAEGFEISFYNANTAFYKYLKLKEANQKN